MLEFEPEGCLIQWSYSLKYFDRENVGFIDPIRALLAYPYTNYKFQPIPKVYFNKLKTRVQIFRKKQLRNTLLSEKIIL